MSTSAPTFLQVSDIAAKITQETGCAVVELTFQTPDGGRVTFSLIPPLLPLPEAVPEEDDDL